MYKVFHTKRLNVTFCAVCESQGYRVVWTPKDKKYKAGFDPLKVELAMAMGSTELLYRSKSKNKAIRFAQMQSLIGA